MPCFSPRYSFALALCASGGISSGVVAQQAPPTADAAPASFRLDPASLRGQKVVRVDGFPVEPDRTGTLVLERFSILTPRTRIVVGHKGGPDTRLPFDPSSVMMYRGGIEGQADSHVYLAVSKAGCLGRVEPGSGRPVQMIVARKDDVGPDGAYTATVGMPQRGPDGAAAVPLCGVSSPEGPIELPPESPQGGGPIRGLQQLEIAVETDYEFFEQVGDGDLEEAAAYALMVYGATSDIYIRDVNTRVDVSFLRLWDSPDDLFNEPDPLDAFRNYWEANMGGVKRDTAQFCSGRRDLGAGGVAWVGVLCSGYGYSWVGYINGLRPSAAGPYISDYDILVTAHELGHNCGVYHSHDYGLDTCDNPATPPRRGGIMSYCGQTFSGSNLNSDLRFETFLQALMVEFINGRNCIADDCNGNGIPDKKDIQTGVSLDKNGNGSPDECEDCNGNHTLDSEDIASGRSKDVDGDGVPDECEQDCNGNGIPDDADISSGTSLDVYMDGVPDECQTDCDGDGLMDYNEIQKDMSLDVDRNAALDACQDCDSDGITDLAALAHSRNVWVASLIEDDLREFYAASGVLTQVSAGAGLSSAQDVVITPGGRIFVSSFDDSRIAEFNAASQFVGDFVGPGGAGLAGPTAMMLTGDSLVVSSSGTNSVLEFRLSDGGFVRDVVSPGDGGLTAPFGLARGPSGTLVVTSADNRVVEFDFSTGQFIRELVAAGSGGLSTPRCAAYLPDGNLLVVSYDNRAVLEYDGTTGAFIKQWNRGGTQDRLVLEEPWGIRVGPDGNVYVSTSHVHRDDPERLHLTKARIFRFDVRNGNLLTAFVEGDDTNLYRPTGFDFMPASPEDCNANQLPDSCDIASGLAQDCNGNGRPDSCDIADGTSKDANGDGIPDECSCYANCDGQGGLDLFDFLCFQNGFVGGSPTADCDGSGGLDLFDFLCFTNAFNAGC